MSDTIRLTPTESNALATVACPACASQPKVLCRLWNGVGWTVIYDYVHADRIIAAEIIKGNAPNEVTEQAMDKAILDSTLV